MNDTLIQRLPSLAVLFFLIVSCSTSVQSSERQKEQQKEEEMKTRVALFDEERNFVLDFDSFQENTQLRVEKNTQSISLLRQKILEERKSSLSDFAKKIRLVETQNKELKKSVDAFDYSKRNEWENFKAEVSRSFDDLENTINDLLKTSKTYQ
ncbi:MAG: hypothetical protein ACXIUD_16995 [Mongoliitalea sp.]